MRAIPLAAILLALGASAGCASLNDAFGNPPPASQVEFEALQLDTSLGAVVAILYANETPETVAFIKKLVAAGYYDGREFNRIIPGFVVQEVDRAGGATDQTEKVKLEAETRVHFSMGAFGIARDADPNSGGSEFFIMDFGHSHLYRNYTAFAQVVTGMDVVHAIARVEAVNTRPDPLNPLLAQANASLPVHDRVAVQPAVIRSASIVTVRMPADVAAHFPRVVGNRTVVDDPPARYTPEWPANLGVGNASDMTWYVYTPADKPYPDLARARALVVGPDGATAAFEVAHDPADPRILYWTWTPSSGGAHTLALEIDGEVVASNAIEIR